jgi:hypothetical protein
MRASSAAKDIVPHTICWPPGAPIKALDVRHTFIQKHLLIAAEGAIVGEQ